MTSTEVPVGVTTVEVLVNEDLYVSSCDMVEFIGPTEQAVFAAAAEWCAPRQQKLIIRAVTFDQSARIDPDINCGLTLIYEPV